MPLLNDVYDEVANCASQKDPEARQGACRVAVREHRHAPNQREHSANQKYAPHIDLASQTVPCSFADTAECSRPFMPKCAGAALVRPRTERSQERSLGVPASARIGLDHCTRKACRRNHPHGHVCAPAFLNGNQSKAALRCRGDARTRECSTIWIQQVVTGSPGRAVA